MAHIGDGFTSQFKNNTTPQWPPTGPIKSKHVVTIITDDPVQPPKLERKPANVDYCKDPKCPKCNRWREAEKQHEQYQKWLTINKSKKEVNMSDDEYTEDYEEQTLYEVVTVYGEDRNKVIVETENVVAESKDRALLQTKGSIPEEWDMDYVTRRAVELCSVRVKRKPREILAKK